MLDILLRSRFSHCALQNQVLKSSSVFPCRWGCGADIGVGRAGLRLWSRTPACHHFILPLINEYNVIWGGGKGSIVRKNHSEGNLNILPFLNNLNLNHLNLYFQYFYLMYQNNWLPEIGNFSCLFY